MNSQTFRDQVWLEQRLQHIWQRGFADLEPVNKVVIKFGQVARTRLGSIRMSRDQKTSKILINRLFQQQQVPLAVVDATIAHELAHYAHGFSSPIEQKFCTPHAGGVVTKELQKRGFSRELQFQKKWLKIQWPVFARQHISVRKRRVINRKKQIGLLRRLFMNYSFFG